MFLLIIMVLVIQILCTWCEYTTANKLRLKQHVNFVHRGIGHLCHHCEFKARDNLQLLQHLKSLHGGIRHICDFCNSVCDEPENSYRENP